MPVGVAARNKEKKKTGEIPETSGAWSEIESLGGNELMERKKQREEKDVRKKMNRVK